MIVKLMLLNISRRWLMLILTFLLKVLLLLQTVMVRMSF